VDSKNRVRKEWRYGVTRTAKIYGGKVVENIVQALARDVFTEKQMLLKWMYGIRAAFTVHDELVAIVPEQYAEWAKEKMLEVFCMPITWWPQVVLFAEADIAKNYADAK
jgi:DNA polymerase